MEPLVLIALVVLGLAAIGFVFRVLFTLAKIALVIGAVLLILSLLA